MQKFVINNEECKSNIKKPQHSLEKKLSAAQKTIDSFFIRKSCNEINNDKYNETSEIVATNSPIDVDNNIKNNVKDEDMTRTEIVLNLEDNKNIQQNIHVSEKNEINVNDMPNTSLKKRKIEENSNISKKFKFEKNLHDVKEFEQNSMKRDKKTEIANFVKEILMPYYKNKIKDKEDFKSLAREISRKFYCEAFGKCSKYYINYFKNNVLF